MKKITVEYHKGEVRINGRKTSRDYSSNGRSVYISDDRKYILKVDDRGYDHDDAGVYSQIEKEDRKYFVPPLAHGITGNGYSWTVQEFIDLDFDVTDEAREIIGRLVDKYRLSDISYYLGSPANWALHNGEPVIFDYGL